MCLCLCVRTKKLIVDVIRIQPGETLSEILETPASAPQVILSLSFDRFLLRYAYVPKSIRALTVICLCDCVSEGVRTYQNHRTAGGTGCSDT